MLRCEKSWTISSPAFYLPQREIVKHHFLVGYTWTSPWPHSWIWLSMNKFTRCWKNQGDLYISVVHTLATFLILTFPPLFQTASLHTRVTTSSNSLAARICRSNANNFPSLPSSPVVHECTPGLPGRITDHRHCHQYIVYLGDNADHILYTPPRNCIIDTRNQCYSLR